MRGVLIPTALLGNFAQIDAARRQAITEVESFKAERNKLSEEGGQARGGRAKDCIRC